MSAPTPEEKFEYLLEQMAEGKSHRQLVREGDKNAPSIWAVHARRRERLPQHADWNARYNDAMALYAQAQYDKGIEIADEVTADPACRKVRIWARHQAADRMAGKITEKHQHTGADDGPIETQLTVKFV